MTQPDLEAPDLFPEPLPDVPAEEGNLIKRLDGEATYREQVAERWDGAACHGVTMKRAALLREAVNALKEATAIMVDVQRSTQGPALDSRIRAFLSRNGKGEG